jgi:Copper transport outer membrane protein, MctB
VIDFRYHLVSIVAVFLALAIGIVLGSTELQGSTIAGLHSLSNSLNNQLSAAEAERDSYAKLAGASDTFLRTSEQKLVTGMLPGDRVVIVTEPGAPSGIISGIKQAAGLAGASVSGTVALQPKFNDLSGATQSSLSAINAQLAASDSTTLTPPAATQTGHQQQAAQLIATATLNKTTPPTPDQTGLTAAQGQLVLEEYAQAGYLTVTGNVTDRATLAVLVTPATAPSDGSADPANQVLLAVAQQFAIASAGTLVAGPVVGSAQSGSAMSVLRGSGVSSQVSSVDNADTTLGQIVSVWALASLLAGVKPNSYGISGASAVSPVPLPEPSVTSTPSVTPSQQPTGKVKKTVGKK